MKKILSILFVLISISISYSSDSKDSSPKKSNKVKYISKYNTNKDKNIVECYFDEKENTYNHKKDNVIIKKYFYNKKADFINERNNFGISLYNSVIRNSSNNFKSKLFYDNNILIREEEEKGNIIWNRWDAKNRNVSGVMEIYGLSNNIILEAEYNEDLKFGKLFMSFSEEILKKYPSIPIEIIITSDDFNNQVSKTLKNKKGEIVEEEIINVIEYSEIEK